MTHKETPLVLGTKNVWHLLLQYAIPSVIAMTASSLYNITDSIFIGQGVGPLAISGLAITFPLMNLAVAFGTLVGVGASTLMSLRLGQKDYSSANHILGNVFILNLIIGLSYSAIILSFLDPILFFFGASPKTLPYAHDYMAIVSLGNVITHLYFGLNAMLRATGHPRKSMYATITSVIINIALTPLFIYGFGWGIRGAALATVLAQSTMLIWQIIFFSKKGRIIHLHKGTFKLKRKIVMDSLSIGVAPFLMNSVSCAIVIVINKQLIHYGGDMAVGAFGIINRVVMLFPMVVMGLNQGMQPIAGYNYGAQKMSRVNRVLKLTMMLATGVMVVGFMICEIAPGMVVSIFTNNSELINIGASGLRIVMVLFPIIGFQMVTSNFFQSIGMPGKAIYLSLSRQVIFLLPGLLILPSFFGVSGVWLSMPLADFLASINAAYILIKEFRKSKDMT